MQTLIVTAKNLAAAGVELTLNEIEKPTVCPGLGGWKRLPDGNGFTATVKWPHAQTLVDALNFNPLTDGTLMLDIDDAGKLVGVEAL